MKVKIRKKRRVWFVLLGVVVIAVIVWWMTPQYYQYEASSAEACLPGEDYDTVQQVCYFDFDCATDQDCQQVEFRLKQVVKALQNDTHHDHVLYSQVNNLGLKEKISYDVINGILAQNTGYAPLAWDIVQTIVPSTYLQQVSTYKEVTDGHGGILAYVEPDADDRSSWIFSIDHKDAYTINGAIKHKTELASTLIHELAHIVSLDHTQAYYFDTADFNCQAGEFMLTEEGCLYDGSYLDNFIDTFWVDDLEVVYKFEFDEDAMIDRFYFDGPSDFVTQYASVHPIEDFAESFMYFILYEPRSGDSLSNKKINFFYQYPEFVSMRTSMRLELASLFGWPT